MAVLAIVTSSPPDVEGGHLVIARALVQAAREAGHDARLIVTPDYGFGQQTRSYLANYRTDVRGFDQVISLRYPSYAVWHRRHVHWLTHTMREYYDQWPQFVRSISPANQVKERVRRALTHIADRHLLKQHVTKLCALSQTVRDRAAHDFGIAAEVVYPPPPQRPYRCDEYGNFIFAISRLMPLKRLDLLVRALAKPRGRGIQAVIAGDGECSGDLMRLADALGVADRVRFLGRIDDAAMLDYLARCRAVCFTPRQEDYGFVTVEAFASRKAVVTCRDSGGPAEVVRDGETGFVCDASASAIADALSRLMEDSALAERLGAHAAVRAAEMRWDAVVRRLVIV
ncbi:MAG TPA: glycosyltransferase family 4 protein [Vicinamibacterales bacterium]|jgi:glycosyltransferase involved in cell wall biosynthesis